MSSSRTHVSYLSPPLNSEPAPRKLKKEERDRDRGGNVLPRTGYQTAAASKMQSVGGGLRLEPGSSRHHHLLAPKLSTTIANAKERRKPHRHGEVSGASQTFTDEHGVTHDSEYVQFRTATPAHVHSQRGQNQGGDDSASSSSASSSDSDRPPSAPYTYQSTHRTSASTHHYSNGASGSALPSYLNTQPRRGSMDQSRNSLSVPRPPSPRRSSVDYDRAAYGSSKAPKARTGSYAPGPQFTTSSYQPPLAPAFQPRAMDYNTSLRLPMKTISSHDSASLTESAARLSLQDNGGSGYNQAASSMRPPNMDGTALDAGVHGLKRSFQGFKLETKFGIHKMQKKVARKILNGF